MQERSSPTEVLKKDACFYYVKQKIYARFLLTM
jgi:hypothetical protein